MAKNKNSSGNLAVISVILGATSFIYTAFTGIPAIILGVMALKRKSGNPLQAKLGIAFGIIGCIILVLVATIAAHFLRKPFNQQTSVPKTDNENLMSIMESLDKYYEINKRYPSCAPTDSSLTCGDWQDLLSIHGQTIPYTIDFNFRNGFVEDLPPGTVAYAPTTTCFLSVPVHPDTSDEDRKTEAQLQKYVALVYFYDGGRACFMTK